MLDVIFLFFLSFSSLSASRRLSRNLCQPANSGDPGGRRREGGEGRGGQVSGKTRRGTKQMIKDQLIKHFLCNLK